MHGLVAACYQTRRKITHHAHTGYSDPVRIRPLCNNGDGISTRYFDFHYAT